MKFRLTALALLSGLLAACGSTCPRPIRVEQDLLDPSPSRRTVAVAAIRDGRNASSIPMLIEMLDDPDPAVRLAAHAALVDLTGRESAYRPWAPEPERREAVLAWRRWWSGRGSGARTMNGEDPR